MHEMENQDTQVRMAKMETAAKQMEENFQKAFRAAMQGKDKIILDRHN
jgi:hypothetical protein